MASPRLPSLPRRLPLTSGELHALADLLAVRFDPDDLAAAGPYRLGGSCDAPSVLVARHEAREGDEPVETYEDLVDVRLFRPFEGLVKLGADFSGDGLYLDPRRRTEAGAPPVVRFCHDEALTAQLEANGLVEYAARGLLLRWAQANGHDATPAVVALLRTPVRLADENDERPALEAVPTQRLERPPLEAVPTERIERAVLAKAQAEARAEAKASAAKAKADAKSKAASRSKSKSRSESRSESESKSKSRSESKSKSKSESRSRSKSRSESKSDAHPRRGTR